MQLPSNTLLHGGKYKIIKKLGQGGFGIVYRAHHEGLQCDVCIKEFFFRDLCERGKDSLQVTVLSTSAEKKQMVDSLRKKFIKEAQRLAQFRNQNIIQVMDNFEENSTAYFVMEYIDGGSLEDLIERNGAMTEQKAKKIIIPIIDALETVHKKGLLHLDIKPANIMLRKDQSPVLIDFGISKFMEIAGGYTTTAPVGISKGYAPMEQYGGNIADFSVATDIYSLSATIYKMVTGNTPPEPLQILGGGLKSPKDFSSKISSGLSLLIINGLSIKVNERPQKISIFRDILLNVRGQKTTTKTIIDNTTVIGGGTEVKNELKKVMQITPFMYNWNCRDFSDGFAIIEINSKKGFINKEGAEVIPCKYDYAWDFKNGIARVEFNGTHFFINNKGNTISTTNQERWNYEAIEGAWIGHEIDDSIVIYRVGNLNLVDNYLDAKNFSEGLAPVKMRGIYPRQWLGKWGYINYDGKLVIPLEYDKAECFSDGLAAVVKNGHTGYINKNSSVVIQFLYDEFGCGNFSDGLALVKSIDGEYKFINKAGKVAFPFNFDNARDFSEGLAPVEKNKKWGYINKNGEVVIPFTYDFALGFKEGFARVVMGDKRGYIKLLS